MKSKKPNKSNPVIGVPKTGCFAYRSGDCMAIEPARCEGCRFYKTRAQNEAAQRRCNEIIAAKPIEEQRYLADKYHQRKMPWKGVAGHDSQGST
jgi:predicted Zn-ribbon and HTH transcriptional regulator